MSAILAEYDIAYIKWDHNRDLIDAGTAPHGRAGVHDQTLATYRLMDELKRRFPGLEIESCSSGGARVDLGILERTDRVWVSDCIDPLERQQMNRWTMQLLPPRTAGLAHRVRNLPYDGPVPPPVVPGGDGAVRAPRDRVGSRDRHRRRERTARGVDRPVQAAPGTPAHRNDGAGRRDRPDPARLRCGRGGPGGGAVLPRVRGGAPRCHRGAGSRCPGSTPTGAIGCVPSSPVHRTRA